tara:strand:+ start:227 stop:481 length:255 start_codon:yes stop_codon:yes gene_type:complete
MSYSNDFGMALHNILTNDERMHVLRNVRETASKRGRGFACTDGLVRSFIIVDELHDISDAESCMVVKMVYSFLLDEVLLANCCD